jgi:hypothetical protein|eukprot:evm.model.NODE_16184_length_8848_cov_34.627373.1
MYKSYLNDAKHVLDGKNLFFFQFRDESGKEVVDCCHLRVKVGGEDAVEEPRD